MILTVVVVALVVLSGLFATGLLKLGPPAKGTTTSATTYTTTFTETGLAAGTSWSVVWNGTAYSSTTGSVTVSQPNGTYGYTVDLVTGFSMSPASGVVIVAGSSSAVSVTFTPLHAGIYPILFAETGLPVGTTWSVNLAAHVQVSVGSTILFSEPNGTYRFTSGTVTGFSVSPGTGLLTVAGTSAGQAIVYTPAVAGTYGITFTQSGLPAGTTWSVSLNGTVLNSSTASITFLEVNGTYAYVVGLVAGYSASPASGTVGVHGASVTVGITFSSTLPGLYSVSFVESGLTLGTSWSVTLNGSFKGAVGSTINFLERNGTFHYTVGAVSGFTATPSSGNVTVNGGPVTVSIAFVPTTSAEGAVYPVTFTQTGLPSNVGWEISAFLLNPAHPSMLFGQGAEGTQMELALPNGTYPWHVAAENVSYVATPSGGNITVNGAAVAAPQIRFSTIVPTSTVYPVVFTESGLPSGATWSVTLNGTTYNAAAGSSITISEKNGTAYFYYVLTSASGMAAEPSQGAVTVDGGAVSVHILFQEVYTVSFTETGLASGVYWSVRLNFSGNTFRWGTPGNFSEPNGTYPFQASAPGYTAVPSAGFVTVNGHNVGVAITFTRVPLTNVTFTESGLPSGSFWFVTLYLDGNGLQSYMGYNNTTSIAVPVPSGNYTWVIQANAGGYIPTPGAGGVYVHGGVSASFSVAFHHAPGDHLVLFEELMYWFEGLYGLPNGTTWSVSLGGTVENTTGMFLLFAVPNGTYAYTVTGPAGYGSLPASGRLTVNSTNPYEFYSPGAYVMVLFAPTTSLVSRAPAPAGSIPSAPESGQMAFLALRSEDPSRTT